MGDRPIIFSSPMVRALMEGRKTMTRRLVTSPLAKCQIGDRLWVRESITRSGAYVQYIADHKTSGHVWLSHWRDARPSIHMPRWASRLTLTVTETNIERLQDITEADAATEGVERATEFNLRKWGYDQTHRMGFADLWDGLHGAGAWDANPEVVALRFTVARQNIDEIKDA